MFNDLGRGVLDNAWKGYNCSLFAYGQTGAGKSYSIIGSPGNKGIVPLVGEELFNGINEKRKVADKDADFQVWSNRVFVWWPGKSAELTQIKCFIIHIVSKSTFL